MWNHDQTELKFRGISREKVSSYSSTETKMGAGGSDYQLALLVASLVSVGGCLPVIVYHCRRNCCRDAASRRGDTTKLRRLEACFGNATLCSVGFVSCVATAHARCRAIRRVERRAVPV